MYHELRLSLFSVLILVSSFRPPTTVRRQWTHFSQDVISMYAIPHWTLFILSFASCCFAWLAHEIMFWQEGLLSANSVLSSQTSKIREQQDHIVISHLILVLPAVFIGRSGWMHLVRPFVHRLVEKCYCVIIFVL